MMKKFALYPGCLMTTEQYSYEVSIRETFPMLDIKLVDLNGFSCCGEPMKSINQMLTLYLSARTLSMAEKKGLDIFVPCAMCHLALSECLHVLRDNPGMRNRINDMLAAEELAWKGSSKIYHTVDLLHDKIGIETIKKHVEKPLSLKVAAHYGCHLIRPSEIGRPVNPENPQKMERILEAIGATPMDYPEKLDCCGAPILANLPESALTKTGQKVQAIQQHGFDALVTVCPWCQKMFDGRQKKAAEIVAAKLNLPVFYLTQLLGIAFGVEPAKLGLELNLSPVDNVAGGKP
jgi:heterodisulfide reductase subunit B